MLLAGSSRAAGVARVVPLLYRAPLVVIRYSLHRYAVSLKPHYVQTTPVLPDIPPHMHVCAHAHSCVLYAYVSLVMCYTPCRCILACDILEHAEECACALYKSGMRLEMPR